MNWFLPAVPAAVSNSRFWLVPGYGMLGARAGIRTTDGGIDLPVFARNLFEREHLPTLSPGNFGLIAAIVGEPRTWGLTLRTRL